MNWTTAATLIGITLMLIAAIMAGAYFIHTNEMECTRNPLVYGAKKLKMRFGHEVAGTVIPLSAGTGQFRIEFNSENWSIQK